MIESAYIHIPFCNHICSYCDFAKLLYQEKWVSQYLKALEMEIQQVYQGESLKTIYVGGGTPSALNPNQLEQLFQLINAFSKQENYEFTIECNVESLTEEKIKCMKQYGVNRISIGVETFHSHHLKSMNRHHTKQQVIDTIHLLKQYEFTNVNIDLIYALPNETMEELKSDLQDFLRLEIPHISTYSLMIEPNTSFYIQNIQPIEEELDVRMYEEICNALEENGYEHYEISNFSKPQYASKHNLTYWNNAHYYGFGLGASGYINETRYTNTCSFTKYCNGNFCMEQEEMTLQKNMENEMILGLRKLKGVNSNQFYQKYKRKIEDVFPIKKLQKEGKLHIINDWIHIPKEQIYLSNETLIQFIEVDKNA